MYVITLGKDQFRTCLWLRRSNVPLKKPTLKWPANEAGVAAIEQALPRHHHLLPKRTTPQWYLRQWLQTTNGFPRSMLRLTRFPSQIIAGEEAMPFDDAYELFMAHARMMVTAPVPPMPPKKKES
jgi:hypothetical protein